MANLQDIRVSLELDNAAFINDLRQTQQQLQQFGNQMSSTGGSMSDDMQEALHAMSESLNNTSQHINHMQQTLNGINGHNLDNLPEHLRPFLNTLRQTQREMRLTSRVSTQSLDEMRDAALRTSVGLDRLTSVSSGGRAAIQTIQELNRNVRETQFAVLGLNENGTVAISTAQSQERLRQFENQVESARREVERLREAGDFGAYQTAMAELERSTRRVNDAMIATARGGTAYNNMLRQLGIVTSGIGDAMAISMERNRDRIIQANAEFQARTTQSQKLIQALDSTRLSGLSQQFLQLGNHLERTARRGTAINLAFQQLGQNAPMKDIYERVQLINQGLMRMQALQMWLGIGFLALNVGIWQMASAMDKGLNKSVEQFKGAWTNALEPFIMAWSTAVKAVINFGTWIGNLMAKFAELHPQLSAAVFGIGYLTLGLTLLLAPLAVGIGLTGGLSAAFSVLWATIAPFVLGFLTVAGTALVLATAIVGITLVIKNCWTASEGFRNALINAWTAIQAAVMAAVAPIGLAWENLKLAFSNLVATVTGGQGTMGNLWTWLGNIFATVINGIVAVCLPMFTAAVNVMGMIITAVINGIAAVVTWMGQMWQQHGTQISAVCTAIWGYVMQAFSAISGFIVSIMPQIISVASSGWELIKTAVDFCMKYIAPVVVAAFGVISSIISAVMPFVLQIIVATWNNIKSAITAAINIIQNVIELFTNILKGNWSGAWNNIKEIVSNALTLVWNLIQLYFAGKLLAPLKGFATSGLSIVKAGWNGIKAAITSVCSAISSFLSSIWSAIASALRGNFSGIASAASSIFNGMKSSISSIFNSVKSTATSVWNAVKTAITNPIETAKNTLLGIISKIVSAFAAMKIVIPKPKLPKVDIGVGHKSIGGIDLPYPTFSVSWNAKGNIFNGASVLGGGQGVGERGAEVVMPISHDRYMQPFSRSVAEHLKRMQGQGSTGGNNATTINFNEPVVIREEADIQKIVMELDKRRRISERSQGVFSYA
ncbi:hypothetical protein ABR772_25875 [Bacillus cereus]|uniref:hypothetical protein n=1 Tax=Bacillus cereus TaxID=1396 RepID=UPI003556B1E7